VRDELPSAQDPRSVRFLVGQHVRVDSEANAPPTPVAIWFPCRDEDPFLHRVRDLAPSILGDQVAPEATVAFTELGRTLLVVEVPQVPGGETPVITNQLQVRLDERTLCGYWGCSHLWDDFDEPDPEALIVRGVPMTVEIMAEQAVDWLSEQLSRPVEFQEWSRRGRVVAERWVLKDTGRELGSRGSRLARRRPPDRVAQIRPPSEP
jgi:hypothetical protein